ncbi:MAG: hypothetical protein AAB649_05260 [Patescibacteria group bacterium]
MASVPPNLPFAPTPSKPGEGFDIPDPFSTPPSAQLPVEVAPIIATKHSLESRHAARWVFVSIGIFIAVVSLVAIIFIGYNLLYTPAASVVLTPSPTATVIPEQAPIINNQPVVLETPTGDTSDLADPDKDGLTNAEERYYGTDINNPDTDNDTFIDSEEVRNGYNPLDTGKLDSDNDGFPDPDERSFGTDPTNPDTDKDGYSDGEEITRGYNPLIASPNDKL